MLSSANSVLLLLRSFLSSTRWTSSFSSWRFAGGLFLLRPACRWRSSSQYRRRRQIRWTKRLLRGIKAIRHIIGRVQSRIDGRDSEQALAKLHEADMRAFGRRYVPSLCIGTDHQAGHPRSIPKLLPVKLRMSVRRVLCHTAIPLLYVGRNNVVVPASPVVPGHENHCPWP